MKIKHNKKRNVGLVFDQLSRLLSESLIKGDTETSKKCSKIIAEHFRKGTALHDEMRLFRSLSGVTIKNDALLLRVLDESRSAAKSIDSNQLSKEKNKVDQVPERIVWKERDLQHEEQQVQNTGINSGPSKRVAKGHR